MQFIDLAHRILEGFIASFLRVEWMELFQIWTEHSHRPIIGTSKVRFRYVALFRNGDESKAIWGCKN